MLPFGGIIYTKILPNGGTICTEIIKEVIKLMTPMEFLIYCYFGSVEEPILAAIDRAYVDMAAHTLCTQEGKIAKDLVFRTRKSGTEIIYKKISMLNEDVNYNEWHKEVVKQIHKECTIYSYGQIQKWLNMTVKYLYTLKALGVNKINDIFTAQNTKMFHAPLDSCVLDEISKRRGEKLNLVWSKDIKTYEEYLDIVREISFEEEYDNWTNYIEGTKIKKSGEVKKADKHTYRRYLQDVGGYELNGDNGDKE